MFSNKDTICAIATPPGEGGIAIVRLSGSQSAEILAACFMRRHDSALKPHRTYYGHILDSSGGIIDEAICVYMRAPKSYTSEDVVEISCHGGRIAARSVLNRALELGARLAEPGEFTRRAFQNGRLGLAEAEAVMALIQSGSAFASRSALNQLEGGVSRFVYTVRDRLLELMSGIEAANDFPDEIDEVVTRERAISELSSTIKLLSEAANERSARIIRDGLSVALVGKPNVGKSSLMNALLGQQRAIVTPVPGTTRDVLTERLRIGNLTVELSDTAGQRDTDDEIEKIGVERAKAAERTADVILMVLDASEPPTSYDMERVKIADGRTIIVLNKTDLTTDASKQWPLVINSNITCANVCATTGDGIYALVKLIEDRFITGDATEHQMTQARHIECAKRALNALEAALGACDCGLPLDVAAIDIMDALEQLTMITGESATEEVIDQIFSRFCVGK